MKERRNEARMVGRENEVARIIELAEAPATGAVLLTGPAGIGKSRLAEGAMVELTSRGWRGVGLSATDPASRVPYAALSALIPDALDSLDAMGPEAAELAVLRAVEDALDVDGAQQVVLVIDDVASFDLPACNLLVHLAVNRRLFIIASQSLDAMLQEALRRLTPAAVVDMEVGALNITGTAELAAILVGGPVGPGLVRNLQARTQGNPLFVCELVESAVNAGAIRERDGVHQLSGELTINPSLGRQIVFRLGLLTSAERDVVELLALAGELGVDDLGSLLDSEALEMMERRGLITTREDQRRFRLSLAHPMHAEAIVADMTALGRRRRHRELVELIERRERRRDEDIVLHGLASLASGQSVDAEDLLAGAYVALRLDRVRDASTLAQSAFDSEVSEVTRTGYAEALIRQGRFVEADALLAEPVPEDASDWERLRRAIRRSSNHLWGFNDPDEAWRIDEACILELQDADAIDRVVSHQAWVEYCDGRSVSAIERTEPLVDSVHPDVRFSVCAVRAPALVLAGRVDEGADLAQRGWDNGWGADTEFGSHHQHLIALGFGKLYGGDLPAARFVSESAIAVCRETNQTTALLFFLELAAHTELLAGELGAALSYFEEALEIGTEVAIASSVRTSLAGATKCRAQMGQPDEAAASWKRILDVPLAPGPRGGADIKAAEAWTVAVNGNPPDAAEILRSAADQARAQGLPVMQLLLCWDLARLGYATGADASAAALAGGSCQGQLLPLLADSIRACAGSDAAELDRVSAQLDGIGFGLWASEAAARAADVWAAGGDQRAATASRRQSDRGREAFAAAQTPGLVSAKTVEPLSRREREVAALARDGAKNSEIAEQLHVSVRTVETHLQKIYRKLGVTSRTELADALR